MRFRYVFVAVAIVSCSCCATCRAAVLFSDSLAVSFPKAAYGYRGATGQFLVLSNGNVMMSYTDQVGAQTGRLAAITSSDEGKTWGQPVTLVPPATSGYNCYPMFQRTANSDVLLSYIYTNYPAEPTVAWNYVQRSSDDGRTWGPASIMTTAPGSSTTPYPGDVHVQSWLTLSNGRIVALAERHVYTSSLDVGYVGMSFYSDDQGHTWKPSDNSVDMYPADVQEADAVQLKDGRLMMVARSDIGHPVRAYSSDNGKSWSAGQVITGLAMPEYMSFMTVRRIPSTGDLLYIWGSELSNPPENPGLTYRCTLSSAISQDEGLTFIHQRTIAHDLDDDFGYQCVQFLNDNTTLVGYHCRDGIRVAHIDTNWFYEVPEPGTLALLTTALAAVMAYAWRKRTRS